MSQIALIDNVSARAFHLAAPQFDAEIVSTSPTGAYEALLDGSCDAGLLPTGCLPELGHRFDTLQAYGIACTGAVMSVRLYAEQAIDEILHSGEAVYVSEKSQTSRRLLHALCRFEYGVQPKLTEEPSEARARLFIGEDALAPDAETASWPHVVDMGRWWFDTNLTPFVYAVWVVRKTLPSHVKRRLQDWLETNVALAESIRGRQWMADASAEYFPTKASALDYYARIRPRLTRSDGAGLKRFLQLVEENDLCRLSV